MQESCLICRLSNIAFFLLQRTIWNNWNIEAVFNELTKPELVQLLLKTEVNKGAQITTLTAKIKELNNYSKKQEADVATLQKVNSRLFE